MKKIILLIAVLSIGVGMISCEKIFKKKNKGELPEGWKRYQYILPSGPLEIVSLAVNNAGVPYIVTSHTLYRLDGETFTSVPVDYVDASVSGVTFDKNNNLFISYFAPFSTSGGISKLSGASWERLNTDKNFNTVFGDKSGNVFAGSNDGLYKYNGTEFVKIDGFNDAVSSITQDASGALWFGANVPDPNLGNVNIAVRYDGTSFTQHHPGTVDYDRGTNTVTADTDGNVYISDWNKAGSGQIWQPIKVLKYNGSSFSLLPLPKNSEGDFLYSYNGVLVHTAGSTLWGILDGDLLTLADGKKPLIDYLNGEKCDCKGNSSGFVDIKSHGNKLWALSGHEDENAQSTLDFGKPETGYLYSYE